MRKNYKKLGQYIQQVNLKNTNGKLDTLFGVNLDKKFMPSVANTIGTDLTKHKVIKKGQFGCKFVSVGRDGKLPISLMQEYDAALISSAYYVFEVKDENKLLSEYLMMWLSRSENDRYLWFMSGADVRGSISWDDFCSIDINIPSIEKQREIVKEYKTITDRIKLNEQLNQKLEETAQAIYKEWFVDFEFPDVNGKPYKSSAGEMEYCDELGVEVPKGWKFVELNEMLDIKYGKDYKHLKKGKIPLYGSGGIISFVNECLYSGESILIPRKGSLNNVLYIEQDFWTLDTMFYSIIKIQTSWKYLFHNLNVGSAVPSMTTSLLNSLKVLKPKSIVLKNFEKALSPIYKHKVIVKAENKMLKHLQQTLLSKMATIKGEYYAIKEK